MFGTWHRISGIWKGERLIIYYHKDKILHLYKHPILQDGSVSSGVMFVSSMIRIPLVSRGSWSAVSFVFLASIFSWDLFLFNTGVTEISEWEFCCKFAGRSFNGGGCDLLTFTLFVIWFLQGQLHSSSCEYCGYCMVKVLLIRWSMSKRILWWVTESS